MKWLRTVVPFLSISLAAACGVTGGEFPAITDCDQPTSDPTFCCPASEYLPIDPALLASDPGPVVGRKISIRGTAKTFTTASPSGCECIGNVCGCVDDLALEAVGCDGLPAAIPLGGDYAGQAVFCNLSSCWPLSVGLPYAVCGEWSHNPTAQQPGGTPERYYWLTIDNFCDGI